MNTGILPNELWLNIISNLSIHEMFILCVVCKHFNVICMDDICWKYRFVHTYGSIHTHTHIYTYRDIYLNIYKHRIKIVPVKFNDNYPLRESTIGSIILTKKYNLVDIHLQLVHLLQNMVNPAIKSINNTYYINMYKYNSSFHCPISRLDNRKYSKEWNSHTQFTVTVNHKDLLYSDPSNSSVPSKNYIKTIILSVVALLTLIISS